MMKKSIILIKQIMKLSTEKSSHFLGAIQPVIHEAEFYPSVCWIPKLIMLTTNYISLYFGKLKECGNRLKVS